MFDFLRREDILLLDTNILIHHLQYVEENIREFTILKSTLVELDRLKDCKQVASSARRAINFLSDPDLKFKMIDDKTNLGDPVDADNIILEFAKRNRRVVVATNDHTLQILLKQNGCDFISVIKNEEEYSGVIYAQDDEDIYSNDHELLYEKGAKHGTYVVHGESGFVFKNGTLVPIYSGRRLQFKNSYCGEVKPRNLEQAFAMDALVDEDTTIAVITGGYGSGKSYLAFNWALQELQHDRKKKIVFIPNNSQAGNTKDYGALPGTLEEKAAPFFASLADILGDFMLVEQLIKQGKLEILPMAFARGRNLENCVVFVNEAQNLTESHVELLIGRIGLGSKIIFDGDIKQTDNEAFSRSPGLRKLSKISDSPYADLFRLVRLQKTERSRTSEVAGWLDEQ